MTEIEVKIRVESAAAARDKILKLGAVLDHERALETNTLYDFSDRTLTAKRRALRLRAYGRKCFLTFKGEPQSSRRFKVREEHEVEVKNERQARKILQDLGLQPVFRYDKHRTVFRRDRLKICLDETSLGAFLELEGDRSRIMRMVELLGADSAALIKLDYVELYRLAGQGPAL